MGKYTAFFREISIDNLAETGGKAANLGELTSAGFRVPEGFCVKTAAFDDYLLHNNLEKTIDYMASQINYKSINDVEEKTAAIRALILAGNMPQIIARAVTASYAAISMNDNCFVAIRSSVGTRDLSYSSFPGQMDTYHNISGVENVIRCVKQCWASVWTARASVTAHSRGISHKMLIIAPVVQTMVQSETAGVVFTSNPANGSDCEIMINANYGLGESVVSGNVTPDQYIVDKGSLTVQSCIPGNKCFRVQYDKQKGQGNTVIRLNGEETERECLTIGQVRELCETAIKIEKHYNMPQDIEWAFAQGILYILQSRRIAGLDRIKKSMAQTEWQSEFDTVVKNPPDTYTSQNIGESMPDVLTPAAQSGLKVLDYGFWKTNRSLGLIKQGFPEREGEYIFIGNFYGRAHLNLSVFKKMAEKVPGGSASEFERPESMASEEAAGVTKFRMGHIFLLPGLVMRGYLLRRNVTHNFDRLAARLKEQIRINRAIDADSMEIEDFAGILEKNKRESMELMALHIANSQLALISYHTLCRFTREWLNDVSSSFAARLVTGLSTLESARPGFAIYNLYVYIRESKHLTSLFLENKTENIGRVLAGDSSAYAFRLRSLLDEFKTNFGYRCVSEAEIMTPSWEFDLDYVYSVIKNYLKSDRVEDPSLIEERQKKDREAAEQEAFSKLGLFKRIIFKKALEESRRFIPGRENNKALFIMSLNERRRFYRMLAPKLAAKKILTEENDIYFLTGDELVLLCSGEFGNVEERINRRMIEFEHNRTVKLPDTFTGRPVPLGQCRDIKGSNVLKGLPVSPGRVTGAARVIIDPRNDNTIQSGEILVVPVTDASWTPLFLLAKGLVVDIGGLLSHGSVVAREYGIPGVLNVINGTKIIKNGQIITVDGTAGEVYIHDQEA